MNLMEWWFNAFETAQECRNPVVVNLDGILEMNQDLQDLTDAVERGARLLLQAREELPDGLTRTEISIYLEDMGVCLVDDGEDEDDGGSEEIPA